MIILFDNGHGIDTKGKCSPDAAKGMMASPFYFLEYAWAREIAQSCCDVMQVLGYQAWLLVPEETDVPLSMRAYRANTFCRRYGKDNVLLVSIHNNAAGDGSKWMTARGWSVYTSRGMTMSDYLAEEIYQEAVKEFKSPLVVRKKMDKYLERDYEENFYILSYTQCPAVLVENFFQDNRDDVRYLKSDGGKGSCIHVITQGVMNFVEKMERHQL